LENGGVLVEFNYAGILYIRNQMHIDLYMLANQ
jgi:hypothetical protein